MAQLTIITLSHNDPTSDGSDILVRFDNMYYGEFPRRIYRRLFD
jgi:hypothetical protein